MNYGKLGVQCHQNWIHLYWDFATQKECLSKFKQLKKKFPKAFFNAPKIREQTIWINSTVDSGKRYYSMEVYISAGNLINVFDL